VHTYETIFITPPTLSEDEEQAIVGAMAQIVTDGGGNFTAKERMGRRRLAYPIQKFDEGVYVRFLYDAEPAVTRELERRIRLSDRVIRSLTVRLEEDWAAAAKIEAVQEAERRAQAEAERAAAEAAEAERAAREAEEESARPAGADDGDAPGASASAESDSDGDKDASDGKGDDQDD